MKSSSGKSWAIKLCLWINNLQRREGIEKALHGDAIPYKLCESWDFEPNTVHVMQGLLTDGFELPHSHLVVVVEGNIYGQQKRKLRNKPKKGQEINYFTDLSVGDYVVHSMHGIGKYVGLKRLKQKVSIETTLKLLMPEQIDCICLLVI